MDTHATQRWLNAQSRGPALLELGTSILTLLRWYSIAPLVLSAIGLRMVVLAGSLRQVQESYKNSRKRLGTRARRELAVRRTMRDRMLIT